jgi:hypothetical protein
MSFLELLHRENTGEYEDPFTLAALARIMGRAPSTAGLPPFKKPWPSTAPPPYLAQHPGKPLGPPLCSKIRGWTRSATLPLLQLQEGRPQIYGLHGSLPLRLLSDQRPWL